MQTQRELFLQYQGQTSNNPLLLEFVKAEGVYMFDKEGNKCLDLISGIGVSSVGHGHPNVINAIKKQVNKYMHLMVYGEFVQTPQLQLAKVLAETLKGKIKNPVSFFINSGSEAVEVALKLSKRYTKRTKIVSAFNAYHGSTHGSLSVCGDENMKNAFRPLLPGVLNIKFNEKKDLGLIDKQTAAVIIEPIQGESGVRIPSVSYMKALRDKCNEVGALLILDEIQVGFGRTGKFWAFENFDIQPDIVVCAKGMGGGMPIAACIAEKEVMAVLKNNPILGHITTFGGNAVCAAAALATLQTILDERLIDSIKEKEELLKSLLVHSDIKEIRGKGLIFAIEFESYEILKPIIDKSINLGVLTDWFLFCDNAMRIAPPLTITKKEIKEACKIILEAIKTRTI